MRQNVIQSSLFLVPCLQVDGVAAGLLAIGLTKGDRLCVWGPNSYEWLLMQFATARAGIVLVSPRAQLPPLRAASSVLGNVGTSQAADGNTTNATIG